jgi:hypothetical protein
MRYVFNTKVISVENRKRTARGRLVDGKTVLDEESLGWFVRFSESSAICVGTDQPPFVAGDTIKITMEKA